MKNKLENEYSVNDLRLALAIIGEPEMMEKYICENHKISNLLLDKYKHQEVFEWAIAQQNK